MDEKSPTKVGHNDDEDESQSCDSNQSRNLLEEGNSRTSPGSERNNAAKRLDDHDFDQASPPPSQTCEEIPVHVGSSFVGMSQREVEAVTWLARAKGQDDAQPSRNRDDAKQNKSPNLVESPPKDENVQPSVVPDFSSSPRGAISSTQSSPKIEQSRAANRSSMEAAKESIRELNPNDVVFNSRQDIQRSGNLQFYELVRQASKDYRSASPDEKTKIACDIVRTMRSMTPAGRFVAKREKEDGLWYDIGDTKAFAKATKLLLKGSERVLMAASAGGAGVTESGTLTTVHEQKKSTTKQDPKDSMKLSKRPFVAPERGPIMSLLATIDDYKVYKVQVISEGTLGLKVTPGERDTFPAPLINRFRKDNPSMNIASYAMSRVESVQKGSLGKQAGIMDGDWFVDHKEDDDKVIIRPISSHEVRKLACDTPRPIQFTIARRVLSEPRKKPKKKVLRKVLPRSSKNASQHDPPIVPFCLKCRRGDDVDKLHHPWCPRNPEFENSGADEIFDRLEYGCKMQCGRCISEFKSGRRCDELEHNDACQKKIRETIKQKKAKKKPQSPKKKQEPLSKTNCKEGVGLKRKFADSSMGYVDDEVDGSAVELMDVGDEDVEFRNLDYLITGDIKHGGIELVPCDNPWGPEGFCDDDVVLYSSHGIVVNSDVLFPSPHFFTAEPFQNSSSYKETHHTPSEGLQQLILTRDVMCRSPWGFSTFLDESGGGACLVAHVDNLGPASAAEFLGASPLKSPLRPKDMILAVNGKPVSDMNEEMLEIELGSSGQRLYVLVSRYKFESETMATEGQRKMLILRRVEASMKVGHKPYRNQSASNLGELEGGDLIETPTEVSQEKLGNEGPKHGGGKLSVHNVGKNVLSYQEPNNDSGSGSVANPSPTNLSTVSTQSSKGEDEESNSSIGTEESEDDGEACMGCVCGQIHQKLKVYWIQCGGCKSWYNVAPKCVGFDCQAASNRSWECPACCEQKGCASSHSSPEANPSREIVDSSDSAETNAKHVPDKASELDEPGASENEEEKEQENSFEEGATVHIREHGWSGVNNPEGGAWVEKSYNDEDGDLVYDVKYIVGGFRKKAILARYVRPYSLD